MTPRAPIQIEGARELRRSLKKAGIDAKELKAVNKAAGEIVQKDATRRAPVGSRVKRAKVKRLRDTLTVFSTQTGARIRAGAKAVPYAAPIHWGWQKRGIKPNPFISTAAQSTEPRWLKLYEEHVAKLLEKIKGA